jgi:hypothetical protein
MEGLREPFRAGLANATDRRSGNRRIRPASIRGRGRAGYGLDRAGTLEMKGNFDFASDFAIFLTSGGFLWPVISP